MPTGHGGDIDTAISKSAYDVSEFKDYVVHIALNIEVESRSLDSAPLTNRVSTPGAV
ncbi:hypothetical protein AmaxDRAFT_3915 [Limnospira maxima CS-328]|uniref:Uncharacterized protein n=2 Tax=Limnospira TaxID=2596745 RepID=A0A9P1P0K5_9CYAN|nr:hypothetical protein AmaxDRAFT_3915 [Limnospira maxima CS-328]UWU49065.1 hypothetical protein APLC1_3879 [Arthrospira platensis C1]CDM94902.1 conserved protein of unknown function [Limnospira indica PCC 8005]